MPKHVPTPIIKVQEPWCEVVLADGAIMAFRTIIKGAYIVMEDDGKTPVKNDMGEIMYGIDHATLVVMRQSPVEKKDKH